MDGVTPVRRQPFRVPARKWGKEMLFIIHNISLLTQTERELVRLLLEGHKVKGIVRIRNVEVITVKTQITDLLRKFGCRRTRRLLPWLRGWISAISSDTGTGRRKEDKMGCVRLCKRLGKT